MFLKLGESIQITRIEDADTVVLSQELIDNFKKTANELKKIAPKANDFLYFSCVMMHAAEASAINEDGTPKLTRTGEPVRVGWDTSGGTWKWVSNDPSIKPYSNSNRDIFPENELILAHKKWVGKPLCIDHKSSSVDHVRGFIVDTYYDRMLKRVVALCALDKINYPDLARKITTGYSNSVSMGTAVGKAVCSDCGTIAKTADDFCHHMKTRSCYGEINVDLNPIELSIVVNGADGKAKIKHIIAAANHLNNYVEMKEKELQKVGSKYTAHISMSSDEGDDPTQRSNFSFESTDLDQLKNDVDKAFEKLNEFKEDMHEAEELEDEKNTDENTNDLTLDKKSEEDEEISDDIEKLHSITASLEEKLNHMKTDLTKLLNYTIKEENMSDGKLNKEAYFQGGGGVNEPTPGKTKYAPDALGEKARMEDKHMKQVADTGDTDELFPHDMEKKKMLARAQAEERALRRQAALDLAKEALSQKKAYFQGGGGVSEPTPGKPKYTPDPLAEKARMEDKHMKQTSDLGDTDELFPKDLEKKKMLSRASLKAKFVKAANVDDSAWVVSRDGDVVLTASVGELSGGNAALMHDTIATKEFGTKLLEKVKAFGADSVKSLLKKAQEMPAPEAAPAPVAAPAPEAAMEMPAEEPVDGSKVEGDALSLAEKVRDLASDLVEAVKALEGEKSEEAPMAATASLKSLFTMKDELNDALTVSLKDAVASLKDHQEELEFIASTYGKGLITKANEELAESIVEDAFAEAKTAVADGLKLMSAVVKYARGSEAIVKKAYEMSASDSEDADMAELMSMLDESDEKSSKEEDDADDCDMADDMSDLPKDMLSAEDDDMLKSDDDLSTKEARASLRAQLAKEASGDFSPMLDAAHPQGGADVSLDMAPEGDLGHVEDLEEAHKQMEEVAKAAPQVRKEAEAIRNLIAEGKLDESDLDDLVAEGLDKDAVDYYKKYFGDVDGGKDFAAELTKEHLKAQMEEELETYKVKLARAYELTYDMVDRGLCSRDREAIKAQVDEVVRFNDEGFESLKRVVAKHDVLSINKVAAKIPQVGLFGGSDVKSVDDSDLSSLLSKTLSTAGRRNF